MANYPFIFIEKANTREKTDTILMLSVVEFLFFNDYSIVHDPFIIFPY